MLASLDDLLHRARQTRWLHVAIVHLRLFLGFAFVPAGLKKLLAQPFTAPENTGVFHDFLHAFHATGPFYQFVGVVQLFAAVLLMTQRFATVGACLLLPIITAILVFCWSTRVYPTALVVTLMFLGTVTLLLWDLQKWRGVFVPDDRGGRDLELQIRSSAPTVDLALWERCGAALLVLYVAVCAGTGEIYRPRGVELDNPAFYLFPLMLLLTIVTFFIDRARYRKARAGR